MLVPELALGQRTRQRQHSPPLRTTTIILPPSSALLSLTITIPINIAVMTFRKLAAAASLALAAEAFILPSTITLPGVDIDGQGDFHALRMPDELPEQLKNIHLGFSKPLPTSEKTHVELPCKDCSFKAKAEDAEDLDTSVANSLVGELMDKSDEHS